MLANEQDVLDETLNLYKANSFFRNFELKGPADRLLVYMTLYVQDCILKLSKCPNKNEALKQLSTYAMGTFAIPGEPSFPLNAMYQAIPSRADQDTLRQYLSQARQEITIRLCDRAYPNPNVEASKVCFTEVRSCHFMNLIIVVVGVFRKAQIHEQNLNRPVRILVAQRVRTIYSGTPVFTGGPPFLQYSTFVHWAFSFLRFIFVAACNATTSFRRKDHRGLANSWF